MPVVTFAQEGNACASYFNENSQNITTDVTWNTARRVSGTITVKAGATLRIENTTVEFDDTKRFVNTTNPTVIPSYTRIVVEKGALLYVYSSTLTSVSTTDFECTGAKMWDGIVALGDATAPQNSGGPNNSRDLNQGKVTLISSTIEKARIGVLLGSPQYNGLDRQLVVAPNTATAGAWIFAQSTTFLNCHTGVHIASYPGQGLTAANRLKGCIFRGDKPLADGYYAANSSPAGTQSMQYGIRSGQSSRVDVQSTFFELVDGTTDLPTLPYALQGYGIYADDAPFDVAGCTFTKLQYGIWSFNTALRDTWRINNCTFVQNRGGATLVGVVGAEVRRYLGASALTGGAILPSCCTHV